MSTYTFVNALIGLAREYKMKERNVVRVNKRAEQKGLQLRRLPPAFGADVTAQMLESGYFLKAEAEVFGDALQGLLDASDPRRTKK